MTYNECVDYILSIPKFADKLGTDNLNRILSIMDHPERSYPVIHVAGTNGKGSTCSYLASILKEKSKRVGIFTSPHLIRLNERIRVNDNLIADDEFTEIFCEVMEYIELAEKRGISHPSFFEFVFLMSTLYFRRKKVDYAIAVGPMPMMRAVADLTRNKNIYTEVSMNPIMVDGTGMCGACRITVGGETKFACVDGPDFDAHKVDFDEVINRTKIYKDQEKKRDENCNLLKQGEK